MRLKSKALVRKRTANRAKGRHTISYVHGVRHCTKDPDLLRKEYELIMAGLPSGGVAADAESAAVFGDLLDRRDHFIARRIDKTLLDGETGILFLGALHRATAMLPNSISVMSLREFLSSGSGL